MLTRLTVNLIRSATTPPAHSNVSVKKATDTTLTVTTAKVCYTKKMHKPSVNIICLFYNKIVYRLFLTKIHKCHPYTANACILDLILKKKNMYIYIYIYLQFMESDMWLSLFN